MCGESDSVLTWVPEAGFQSKRNAGIGNQGEVGILSFLGSFCLYFLPGTKLAM